MWLSSTEATATSCRLGWLVQCCCCWTQNDDVTYWSQPLNSTPARMLSTDRTSSDVSDFDGRLRTLLCEWLHTMFTALMLRRARRSVMPRRVVCQSVCSSVTLLHIGWNTSKIISRQISKGLCCLLSKTAKIISWARTLCISLYIYVLLIWQIKLINVLLWNHVCAEVNVINSPFKIFL